MAAFCIVPEIADKLKKAIGDNVEVFRTASSADRRNFFEHFSDKETAQQINTSFERALASKQKDALLKWAERNIKGKKEVLNDVTQKINGLDSELLNPHSQESFLEDLVAEKLGVRVSAEEAKGIYDRSQNLQSIADKITNFGDHTDNPDAQLEYFTAKKQMDDYIQSLNPQSNIGVLTGTITRGNMLASLSPALINAEIEMGHGAMETLFRRVKNLRLSGDNTDYAIKQWKFQQKIATKTGYDIARMQSLKSDRVHAGESRNNVQGPGAIRKVGRIYSDLVMNRLHSSADNFFAGFAANDRGNLESTVMAAKKGLRGQERQTEALRIFKDASSLEPKTTDGQLLRQHMLQDALHATLTDNTWASKTSENLRKVFNIGDFKLGDNMVPFVKKPANAVAYAFDLTGVSAVAKAFRGVFRTAMDIKQDSSFIPNKDNVAFARDSLAKNFEGYSDALVRVGLGFTGAYLLASTINPNDFIGDVPTNPSERALMTLKNAPTNSVKIGNHWVSLDYFGGLSAGLLAMLYAKKYGHDYPSYVQQYLNGMKSGLVKIPGVTEVANFMAGLKGGVQGVDITTPKGQAKEAKNATTYVSQFVASHFIMGIVGQVAKATDTTGRLTTTNPLDPIKAMIPGMREQLPAKTDIFGRTTAPESLVSVLTTGARTATDRNQNDPVVNELQRLSNTGKLPSLTDVPKTDPSMLKLQTQIGATTYQKAAQTYYQFFGAGMKNVIASDGYQGVTDLSKVKILDEIKTEAVKATLKQYGYEKTPTDKAESRTIRNIVRSTPIQ